MKMKFFIATLFGLLLLSCKNKVSPCSCAENLKKINYSFDKDLDEKCDKHLDQLNEVESKKWTDSMMKCKF